MVKKKKDDDAAGCLGYLGLILLAVLASSGSSILYSVGALILACAAVASLTAVVCLVVHWAGKIRAKVIQTQEIANRDREMESVDVEIDWERREAPIPPHELPLDDAEIDWERWEGQVSPDHVQSLAVKLARVREEWERAGGLAVTAEHVSEAQESVQSLVAAIERNSGRKHCMELPTIAFHFCFWLIGCAAEKIGLDWFPDSEALSIRLDQVKQNRFVRLASLDDDKRALPTAEECHRSYCYQHQLASRHEELRKKHEYLVQRLNEQLRLEQERRNSRKYQLQMCGWRSMRGLDFEKFLADVLEVLGFEVKWTPTVGDQGVDLIATKLERRIAVQAKGYTGSVGNDAIQQVYSGMGVYRCTSCVVITNSSFSGPAWELSRIHGCRLIDGSQIPALIEGNVEL